MHWAQRYLFLWLLLFLPYSEAGAEEQGRLLKDGRIELPSGEKLRLASIRLVEQKSLKAKAFSLIEKQLANGWTVKEPIIRDRYGDQVAIIRLQSGQSLQSLLLKQGLARVYPQAGEGGDLTVFFAFEAQAREAKQGLWNFNSYHVVSAETAVQDRFDLRNYYQLVEGTIIDVAKVRGNIYLNFGEDWREDFTIMIPKSFSKSVTAQGLNYKMLKGKRVRVRGWFRLYGGPLIDVTDARQIEVFE